MLKSTQIFQILQGKAPFVIDVKTPLDSCAVVTKQQIVDERFIELEVQFADSMCYDAAKHITVNVMDANMWSNDYVLTMPNPCAGISNPTIELLDRYKLIARAPAGFGPYEYKWTYNQQVLKGTQSGNTIDFDILTELEGTHTFDIEVTITNEAGCCVSTLYQLEVCAPTTEDIYLTAECDNTGRAISPQFTLDITSECYNVSCGETSRIDYTSLWTEAVPGFIRYDLQGNRYYYSIAPTVAPGVYNILASIKDADGVKSYFKICITVPDCSVFNEQLSLFDTTGRLGCENCQQTEATKFKGPDLYQPCRANDIEIPIQYTGKQPDFSTFSFITSPGQILASPTQLITPQGTAILSLNNTIIYTETGNAITEIIRYQVEGTQAKVVIESEECNDEAPILQDDDVWVDEAGTVTIRPLLNDSGDIDPDSFQFLGPFPGAGQGVLMIGDGVIKYTAIGANLPGKLEMQYTVSSSGGVQAAPAKITIHVNRQIDIITHQESVCLDPNEAFTFYGDTGTYWKYTGLDAAFTINGKTQQFKTGHKIQSHELIALFQTVGTYTFDNIQQGRAEIARQVTIEVLPAAVISSYTLLFCHDDETNYNVLDELFVQQLATLAPGGTWRRYNTDRQYTSTITPNNEQHGTYIYEYVIPRSGAYGAACEDITRLTITIDPEVYAGEDICLKLCSEGPTDPDTLDCRSNKEVAQGSTEECIICLMDKLEDYIPPGMAITQTGTWYLTAAPNTKGNVIVINGAVYRFDVGEPLLVNGVPISTPCIDFSNMVLPDWQFKYVVKSSNGACEDEAIIDVSLFPPPCIPRAIDAPIDVCVMEPEMTLYEFMLEYIIPEPRLCTPTTKGLWRVIGNNVNGYYIDQDGDGLNDYFITSEVARGQYFVTYTYFPDNIDVPSCNQQTCDEDCNTCSREFSFIINFDAGPDIGDPVKWAVCQNKGDEGAETCAHQLNSGLTGTGGTRKWYYQGYNSTNPNVPNPLQTGNIPDIANGPLGRMWNVGEQVLAAHTSAPLDTDEAPEINFDDATIGFYFFRVEAVNEEGCISAAIIPIQVVEGPDSGGPATCESYCSNRATCIDLECLIAGGHTAGGRWTFVGGTDCDGYPITSIPLAGAPCVGEGAASSICPDCSIELPVGEAGFNAANGTLNTQGLVCGTYIFGYEATTPPVDPDFILSDCAACQPSVNFITIVIQDPAPAGEPGNPGSACN